MIKPDHDTRILVPSAPAASTSLSATPTGTDNKYKCSLCNYSTNRINTFIYHQKTHNSPKTPPASGTVKFPTKQIPSTSTVISDKAMSSSPLKLQSEDETNVAEICETSKPEVKIPQPAVEASESVDKAFEPVALPEKTKGKRGRKTQETRIKLAEKVPKTDNKLRTILDDWSDDEIGEAGPSGLTSNKNGDSSALNTDDEDNNIEQECSVKKKLKFDNDKSRNSNGAEVNKSDLLSDSLSSESVGSVLAASVIGDKIENQPKLTKKNVKDEAINLNIDDASNEVKPQTRYSMRSGKTPFTIENSTPSPTPPKRRGRAKRTANDTLKCEATVSEAIKDSEIELTLPEKCAPIENTDASSSDKVSESESINTASVQAAKGVKKSNSKTSRKGKPRRKEEIKLANNMSVAVLVEKSNSCPSTENGSEQKLPAEDSEYTNVVHKKIRYMSHSSTDDQQKSSELIEKPKLPEPDIESSNHTDDRMIVEPDNHKENDIEITKVHSNDQNEENNLEENKNDEVPEVSEQNVNINSTVENSELAETINESSIATETPDEQRVVQKCYTRNAIPKTSVSLDETGDTSVDTYESPSSSNLRQREPKRYENTRNRRRSDRRTTSDDDFSVIVNEIDDNCEKNDCTMIQKPEDSNNSPGEDNQKLLENLNDSRNEGENSNSKTSTPENADTSKELDCFDFTEDDCLKLPPQVLNRRKRLPLAKVFELEDIDKIEEQRKIDEEASRIEQQREEENQKLHAELENLLNSTTPVDIPDISVGPKVHENFPERRAEKDPEKLTVKESDVKDRMLPPKERNKRIFKYRNRNRRPDSVAKVDCDVEERKGTHSLQQAVCMDEASVVATVDEIKEGQKLHQSNDQLPEIDMDKNPSAHDLKIEIAKTLINFPLLSPQTDGNVQSTDKVVIKPPAKRKESVKSTRNVKKLRNATASAESISKIEKPESNELLGSKEKDPIGHGNDHNLKPCVSQLRQEPSTTLSTLSGDLELLSTANELINKPSLLPSITKTTETESVAAQSTTTPTTSNPVRDFSRIRHIEKMDNHTPNQSSSDEVAALKAHQLPLKKTVILKTESIIMPIPKKRKSQMEDDVPAFVIERPIDLPDAVSETNNQDTLTKKEPKSFIVTKTVKKQITGDQSKLNTLDAGVSSNHYSNEGIEKKLKSSQQEPKAIITTNASQLVTPISNSFPKHTQIVGASEISSIESPVIVTSHVIIHKNTPPTNAQKRTAPTTSNTIGSLSANRPCTIAPAKKASYRKPTDMTGLTQKQIGIDGKGNPVMIYTKITPIVTQTPPIKTQATFAMKHSEPVPSTSQMVQSFTPALQSNQGNQFVITSKGALITNKPFITTTHSTQPTLTNRPNIQVHTQIIRSPNPSVFQTQQKHHQQQHPSPQSNQIFIHTKPTNSSSSQISSSIAPVKKQPTNRRSVVNKTETVNEDSATFKKRIVRRISKNQHPSAATQQMQSNQQQQQQIILNTEMNHIGNAVPPLIPLNDQSPAILSRKQQPTQMTFIQEPQVQSKTVEVVEQQQENMQEILALPGDTPGFGGPPGSYFLCKLNEMGVYVPIDHQPLYLDVTDTNTNLLKPNAPSDGTVITEAVTEIPQQVSVFFFFTNVST